MHITKRNHANGRESQLEFLMRQSFWLVLIGLLLASGSGTTARGDETWDLLIRGGRLLDGTGNPAYHADLAVQGDRIVRIGKLAGRGRREIDATGLLVAPGFIDIHSHSDFLLLEDGDAQSKIRQGVTTEVLGEGSSAAPAQGQLQPRQALVAGQAVRWTRLSEYFDALERGGTSVNVASYVGLGTVWECVLGSSFDRPTPEQLQAMQRLVAEAMDDGARGLSSQVMMPPGSLATTDDIVALCRVVAPYGGIYSTHIRNEGDGVLDSVREAIEIGQRAGVPVDIIHLKIADQRLWGRMDEVIGLIEQARRDGHDVQTNVYPYTRGNNNLVSIIPPWAHEGGKASLLERLRDPAQRPKLKRDIQQGLPGWYNHLTAVGSDWSRILISGNHPQQGLTMDRVLALRGAGPGQAKDALDELFDMLIAAEGSISAVYAHHSEEDMNLALRQPWCSVGSDGSAYAIDGPLRRGNPHPRNFGTFPRVLGVYVRDNGLLTWEDAIRKMTWLNASKIGLRDRGLLLPGMLADLTLFDPREVRDKATYTEPFQYNEGIRYVVVNGQLVLDDGRHTGARPGRALRK
ncbi:MAG: D-aminoacylase [Pirellulaceae bacterium]|nr:D-aminoacylase [Pirellulaceae bacterium]